MQLPGHPWHPNSRCEYEYDCDRILIKKNTFHLSKLVVGFLLVFYEKKGDSMFMFVES